MHNFEKRYLAKFYEEKKYSDTVENFLKESNAIENIHDEITQDFLNKSLFFIDQTSITLHNVLSILEEVQPNAVIRNHWGMDVAVGGHSPPKGNPNMKRMLSDLLDTITTNTPFHFHCKFEKLHPFTDGNGRVGRLLWLWQMRNKSIDFSLGFKHTFYYQTLTAYRE